MGRLQLGIDVGGTFTDFVLLDQEQGTLRIAKVLTTPEDPSRAVLEGTRSLLESHGASPGQVQKIIHGTTLVANAIIERKGARTGLITTRGFRDSLEAGREVRYETYDLFADKPPPLVPRHLRMEATERLRYDGSILVPLDEEEVEAVIQKLVQEGVEAVAVCFLHSYANPVHEQAVERLLARLHAHLDVTISSALTPEVKEYERASTTVANAYVRPLTRQYLRTLEKEFHNLGVPGRFFSMLSNGGIGTVELASDFPVRLIESGPVGGVLAAAFYGELTGLSQLIAFDMGGTTTKVCLVENGRPVYTNEFEVARMNRFRRGSGLPIRVRAVEMVEVGAGGGSIARADALGVLKVGPSSAGADPGPACYGLGGLEPTVTDADLRLGYLNPSYFLGGRMPLDETAVARAMDGVASRLGIDALRVAVGIHELINDSMAIVTRTHTVERGRDPRNYALVVFGGAGPVHAYGVARRLKIRRVICPLGAGVTSSLGFLIAPLMVDLVRSMVSPLDSVNWDEVNSLFSSLEAQGRELLGQAGADSGQVSLSRFVDMRYAGQAYEVSVPVPQETLGQRHTAPLTEAFYVAYRQLFESHLTNVPVEAITWRLVAKAETEPVALRFADSGASPGGDALKGQRKVYFAERGDFVDCPVYDRYALKPGTTFSGPAIVEERESTAAVGPSATAAIDEYRNLVMEMQA